MIPDSAQIHKTLKEFFGYDTFKGDQEAIINHLVNGNDAFVLMPTGGGKSLCYQLPALLMEGTAIVISPLIALMKNQVDVLRAFTSTAESGIANFLNSSLNKQQVEDVRSDLLSGKTKLLYVAPETLTKEENLTLLQGIKVSFYAVDEAHCISEWGHDFRPEYRRIRDLVERIGRSPIIALTATATPKVQSDILKTLGISNARVFKSSFNRPNLYYEVRNKVDVDKDLVKFIRQNSGKSGIVYCLSRKKVEELAELLSLNGIKALPYHAGLDAKTRAENQDRFLMEDIDVIVATIAFGMGIDKPDVRFVVHYDISKSIESYYQETGRAGRDGGEGLCIAYYSYDDLQKLEKFMQGKPVSELEIGRQLLGEVMAYCESNQCRRKLLLGYFGEEYHEDKCDCCDNCLHPHPTFDGQKEMRLILELVNSLPENFKAEHLANILTATSTALVKSYKHDHLKYYGAGKQHSVKFWISAIHQGMIATLLEKDIESYGLMKITEAGSAFLKEPKAFKLVEDRHFGTASEDDEDGFEMSSAMRAGGGGGDQELLSMLKGLRKDLAKKQKIQPGIIFGDPALEDMSIRYPITLEELAYCVGVGQGKAEKYGPEFISLIKKYVTENEIERPEDIRLISNDKSKPVHTIVPNIDKHLPLEDIAELVNMDEVELLAEMEKIVAGGMKLNVDHYLEHLNEDDIEELFEFFDGGSDLQEAIDYYEGAFDEIEIRLLRVKYICEKGL